VHATGYIAGHIRMPPLLRLLAVAATVVWLLVPRPAAAYPQWQLTTGAARCNQCHYAPAGGGIINAFGRDAVGEQLSTFGGDGAFLHGAVALPKWLAITADVRGAFVDNDVQDPDGPTIAAFPMQADLTARVAFGAGISAVGIIGYRGQAREDDSPVPYQNYQPISTSQLISREHYLMWQPEATGPYVRVGRYFAPFGLRFPEHNLYIRRDLGYDQLTETYNASVGWTYDAWELHLTAFAPDFVRHIGSNESGAAIYYERRLLDDHLALGAQMRAASGPGLTRVIYGAVAKLYVESLRTLFLAEGDGVQLLFDQVDVGQRTQVVGAAGLAVLPIPSVILTLLGEHNQVDVDSQASWTAATALLNWFPYAHCEAQVMGRLQFPRGSDVAKTLFIQVHYFF
jgi:hypothetical protein